MRSVNIHEAKTHLSRLVEQAAAGEPFIIAKSGKPIVKVTAIDTPARAERRRVGFLQGEIDVPHDFDEMGRSEIEHMFSGSA
jgi:prevent-host-death family protein